MTVYRYATAIGIVCGIALFGCGIIQKVKTDHLDGIPNTVQANTETHKLPIGTDNPNSTQAQAEETATSTGLQAPIIYFTGDLVSRDSISRAKQVVALIDKLMAQHSTAQFIVASTGDNEQEDRPTLADYQLYFGTTYGKYLAQGIFRPVRGNHDIQDEGQGRAYASYFESEFPANKVPIAGGKMYFNYSYDFGDWHIIGLDQVFDTVNQAALDFLRADTAAHPASVCQLVYWHVPTYSSGVAHGDAIGLRPLNQLEYTAGVDIQINGHDHNYQRFYPLNPSGERDDAKGITTFIDGIGGEDDRKGNSKSVAQSASVLFLDSFPGEKNSRAIGVIQFTLHSRSADFVLYSANDGSVLDQGNIPCH
jgi:hypothetical protein